MWLWRSVVAASSSTNRSCNGRCSGSGRCDITVLTRLHKYSNSVRRMGVKRTYEAEV